MDNKNKKIDKYNILIVNIQIVVTIFVLVFGLIYLLKGKYRLVFEILMAIDLLIMAYNNIKIYHKKFATYLYILFAIILILFTILSLFGVM